MRLARGSCRRPWCSRSHDVWAFEVTQAWRADSAKRRRHLSSYKRQQDEQAPHRACAGACRRPRGALRAARAPSQRLNRPDRRRSAYDGSVALARAYRAPPRVLAATYAPHTPLRQRRGANSPRLSSYQAMAEADRGPRKLHFPNGARAAASARHDVVVPRHVATTPSPRTHAHTHIMSSTEKAPIRTQARDRRPVEPRHRHGPGPLRWNGAGPTRRPAARRS